MAETETDSSKLPPETLVTEIEKTRADLARTIDEISDRVARPRLPGAPPTASADRVSQIDPLVGGAVALAVVSVTCFLVWRRLRGSRRKHAAGSRSAGALGQFLVLGGGQQARAAAPHRRRRPRGPGPGTSSPAP